MIRATGLRDASAEEIALKTCRAAGGWGQQCRGKVRFVLLASMARGHNWFPISKPLCIACARRASYRPQRHPARGGGVTSYRFRCSGCGEGVQVDAGCEEDLACPDCGDTICDACSHAGRRCPNCCRGLPSCGCSKEGDD